MTNQHGHGFLAIMVRMRPLLLSVLVLAGLAYLGRQYDRAIGRPFGTSTGAVSREEPVAGAALGMNLQIFTWAAVWTRVRTRRHREPPAPLGRAPREARRWHQERVASGLCSSFGVRPLHVVNAVQRPTR